MMKLKKKIIQKDKKKIEIMITRIKIEIKIN